MAVNYATKYASAVDERFRLSALTTPAVNDSYDWTGAKTVQVYTIPTVAMSDYSRTGTARYGTPSELDNTLQELTLAKDRGFAFIIDRGNYNDMAMTNAAGEALQRQVEEVVIPEIDTYRLSKMATGAGTTKTETVSSSNAYDLFLEACGTLSDNKVPLEGRVAFVAPAFYKAIKQDGSFVKGSDMAHEMLSHGVVGMVDGVSLIQVPTSYMPEDTTLIMAHPLCTTAPVKLADYKIHDNPPGINGWLIEGRVYYDAFVLSSKKKGIYIVKNAAVTPDPGQS